MRVRSSNDNVKGLVCLDPLRNIYRLRWDFSKDSYEEVELKYKPSKEDIQSIIEDYYNKQTEENIINGFSYKGNKVYLSRDNQLNYLLFANSTIFPINVKFGTSDNPIYYTFESKDEMNVFVNKIANHISSCLQDGWNKKKNIDWNLYEL